ncbi:MAG: metallophosphoesterase family protein [Microbacterium sp.]
MSTRMLLLADTHVPKRAKRLPDAVLRAIDDADVVVHAGDWVDAETLDLLESRARVLHGVFGRSHIPWGTAEEVSAR